MAKYLKIDEILEKTGTDKTVEITKSASVEHIDFDDFINKYKNQFTDEEIEMIEKNAGIFSKGVKGLWSGLKWGARKAGEGLGLITPKVVKKHKISTAITGAAGGKIYSDIKAIQRDKDFVKKIKGKRPDNFVPNEKYQAHVDAINKKYKDQKGSVPVATQYGDVYVGADWKF